MVYVFQEKTSFELYYGTMKNKEGQGCYWKVLKLPFKYKSMELQIFHVL